MSSDGRSSGRGVRAAFIAVMVTVTAVALVLILTAKTENVRPVKIGCVFEGSVTEGGWNSGNYVGAAAACDATGVELAFRENVPPEEQSCRAAVDELAAEHCTTVFLTSYGYCAFGDVLKADHPEISFFTTGSEYDSEDLTFYFGRMYQGRYLAGIIAGLTTKTNVIGYVAAMPNNEVIRGIDAFALGARSVNPDARIIVRYTGSWDDAEREKQSVIRLAGLSADVIGYHQNRENVPEQCEKLGIDFIGCYGLSGSYSEHCLTSVECGWKMIYAGIIRDSLSRRYGYKNAYWLGLGEGGVSLAKYSENVSVRARYEVMFAVDRIKAGKRIFSGEIYDNRGVLRCGEDEILSDSALLHSMDWYAEGVEIDEGE